MAGLYPLPMRFTSDEGDIDITVSPDGWAFDNREAFDRLPVPARLDFRRAFEEQVALAKRDAALKGGR